MAKLRRVRKWGNSFVIVLAPSDVNDNKIYDSGMADIEDIIFMNKFQMASDNLKDSIAKQDNDLRAKKIKKMVGLK